MKHLFLTMAILSACGAFLMAICAASQAFGMSGKLDASKFILGPSRGWLVFDVLGFFWDVGLTAVCFHWWMSK